MLESHALSHRHPSPLRGRGSRNRKAAIALLLERTPEQDRAELAVLEAARGVEAQRRAEAAARRAAQPPGAGSEFRVAGVFPQS